MSPVIDFTQVEDLKPLPRDWYLASIVEAKEGVSKQNNAKIDLRWKVEEGEFEGRNIFDTITFTQKALFRVKATLKGLGYPEDFSGEIVPEDLVGKTARILVDIEQSTQIDPESGEPYPPRNRIKKVVSPTAGGVDLSRLLEG
jgi:hypothetical protein